MNRAAATQTAIANVGPIQQWALFNKHIGLGMIATTIGIGSTYTICDSDVTIEEETGVAYEATTSGDRVLLGTSARLMGGLVRVYSVGLYVSPTNVRKLVSERKNVTREELRDDEKFWLRFGNTTEPVFRLVVVREVNGHHMCTGFERGLARAASARKPSGGAKKFAKLFKNLGVMKIGSVMHIECTNGDTVNLIVDDRFIGQVKDAELVNTICNMYLSDKAVTPNLRVDVANGIMRVLDK